MAVDFWADKYWNGQYFNVQYFGQGQESAGAMSASLSGSGDISATLNAAQNEIQGGGGFVLPRVKPKRKKAIRVNIAASLAGAGDVVATASEAANLYASVSGSGDLQAVLGGRHMKTVVEANNDFLLLAA
jgi:hypothetical protein